MGARPSQLIGAAAAVAAPAWIVLLALAAAGVLAAGPALLAALGAFIIAGLLAGVHLAELSALARKVADLAIGADESPRGPSPRTPFLRDAVIALSRARRRIAAAQRQMEARAAGAEAVVDAVPEPLLVLDRRQQVLHANLAAETLLGRQLVGRDLAAVLRHPAVLSTVAETLADKQGRAVDLELALPVERSLRARVAPLAEWGAEGDAIVLTLEDQTSIRRSEQMRVDFVANVSHELRTPLATLLGFIETLRGPARDDTEARERFLGIMQDQATRMRRIVDDLLSLSRIELDEHIPPTEAVDIGELLRSVAESLELVAAERQMRIVLDCPEGLPRVSGDDDQLAQVFTNLLDNAVKYGRLGTSIEVTVRGTRAVGGEPADDPRYIAMTVRDCGEGIPREHLSRLTERFYRVDTGRSRELGGTGLGLAIVKHIVSRHRGALSIRSKPGEGSSFTVTLPVRRAERPDALPSNRVSRA